MFRHRVCFDDSFDEAHFFETGCKGLKTCSVETIIIHTCQILYSIINVLLNIKQTSIYHSEFMSVSQLKHTCWHVMFSLSVSHIALD